MAVPWVCWYWAEIRSFSSQRAQGKPYSYSLCELTSKLTAHSNHSQVSDGTSFSKCRRPWQDALPAGSYSTHVPGLKAVFVNHCEDLFLLPCRAWLQLTPLLLWLSLHRSWQKPHGYPQDLQGAGPWSLPKAAFLHPRKESLKPVFLSVSTMGRERAGTGFADPELITGTIPGTEHILLKQAYMLKRNKSACTS